MRASVFAGLLLVCAGCSRAPIDESRGGDLESDRISAIGRVEPRGGLVAVSAAPGSRIGTMSIRVGDEVKAGAPLFVLDAFDELEAHCALTAAQLEEARTLLDREAENERLLRGELDIENSQVAELHPLDRAALMIKAKALRKARDAASADLVRLQELKRAGSSSVSRQQVEAQVVLVSNAQAELEAGETQLKKLEASQKLTAARAELQRKRIDNASERAKLAARVKSLEATHKAAVVQRDRAVVRAPRDGQILRISTQVGEMVGNEPVLVMGDTRRMEVVAEVSELYAHKLHRAGAAVVTALDEELHGRTEPDGIGRIIGRNTNVSLDPTVEADRRVILVRILLDEPSSRRVANLTNLQVDVKIPLEPETRDGSASTRPEGDRLAGGPGR